MKSIELVKTQAICTRKSQQCSCSGSGCASFVQTDVICIFEAFGLGRDGFRDMILLSCFFCCDQICTYLYTLFLCETDMRLDFMLECADQEPMNTVQKVFFVLWAVVSWFVNSLQVLIWFQGLSTSPFLCEEVCICVLCKACHTQWFTKKVHAWKVCMPAHLDHRHVQHKS